jgi:hypothetical protein
MAYSNTNSKKKGRSPKSNKRPKPDRRWTLLFIGNRGRTITLKRFKGMVLLTLLILSVSIATAAGLFLWNQNIIREKYKLESNLKIVEQQLQALRHEKDILMTRLVLAESKVQENLRGMPAKRPREESTSLKKNDSGETKQNTQLAAKTVGVPVQERAEPKKDNDLSEPGLSVAIENFKISNSSNNNKLKVQFKIKNTSPNSQHVSGHAIVVLKGEQIEKNNWLSIPGMPLVDGKPTGRHQGYSFGINYFRTMRFSRSFPMNPDKYQIASVYIFTRSGQLLLEQDFAVTLAANEPKASTQ